MVKAIEPSIIANKDFIIDVCEIYLAICIFDNTLNINNNLAIKNTLN